MSVRPNLFGADIAGQIYKALGNSLLDATLTRVTAGTRDAAALTAGQVVDASSTSYPCKGFIEDYRDGEIDGTAIRHGDRKIILLGKSLPDSIDPLPGDVIAIEGESWVIVPAAGDGRVARGVNRDPAGATFACQARQ